MTRLPLILAVVLIALAAAAPARAQERLSLLLDWFVNPNHGPILVAEARGLFRAQGLDVVATPPSDPADPPKLVAAGRADLAISYQPQLHLQIAAGLPLIRVATLIATPLNTIVALESSPVRAIADLKGRAVGSSVPGVDEAMLSAVLGRAGLTLADVRVVNVGFNLSQALLTGQVDAVIGAYRNFELNHLALLGRAARPFFLEEEGVPPYDELIVVARADRAGDPRIGRFVAALEQGVAWTINHPEPARALFVQGRPELDDALNRRAWADTLPRFAHRPAAVDRQRYADFAAFLAERRLIPEPLPVERYALEPARPR